MNIAFLIDPLPQLNRKKDTSLAMMLSVCQRGLTCSYFTPEDIACFNGRAYASLTEIKIKDLNEEPRLSPLGIQPLGELDIIIMRKDPPFDLEYIYNTYALELAEKEGVLIANKPQSLRDANEKFFTLHFPQCCPATLVSKSYSALREFWQTHKQVIYKPLSAMGGAGVFYVGQDGANLSVILELLTEKQRVSIMAQQYIPDIINGGDKRIIVINGIPVPYALARIPAKGELRGNLAAGAQGNVVEISDRDRWICQQIAPTLKARGLYFVGIDVIGRYLTEINVTSPTGAREIAAASGIDVVGQLIEQLCALKNLQNCP